jgi:hypothetical protein
VLSMPQAFFVLSRRTGGRYGSSHPHAGNLVWRTGTPLPQVRATDAAIERPQLVRLAAGASSGVGFERPDRASCKKRAPDHTAGAGGPTDLPSADKIEARYQQRSDSSGRTSYCFKGLELARCCTSTRGREWAADDMAREHEP